VNVTVNDGNFNPEKVDVKVGTTVRWTISGQQPHNITSMTGTWKSNNLTTGQSFSFTFNKAGTYMYQCTIHPQMRGTVIVR